MLFEERAEKILVYIGQKGTAGIAELAEMIGTSESTIRRDIAQLDQMGKLKRVYGGAARLTSSVFTVEEDIQTKSAKNTEQKMRIAEYAAAQIHDRELVYIDAGTTTMMMIPFIRAKDAVFVTNGVAHAKMLTQAGHSTYIVGGKLKSTTEAIVGSDAIDFIRKYNFSKCFMGTNGMDAEHGFTTPDIDEARMKEEAMKHSYVSYVLADASKFRKVSAVTFARIESACVITDAAGDKAIMDKTVVKVV